MTIKAFLLCKKKSPIKAFHFLWLFIFCGCTSYAYGHAYMDFSIEDVWLDKECHLNVAVRNVGGSLPDHFYFTKKPAVLKITKGPQEETSASVTTLDKNRLLSSEKDVLVIKSKTVFSNNTKPVNVTINYGPEFGDFNQRNDSLTSTMDCRVGEGQVAGEAIMYHAPDIAINNFSIDETSCEVKLELFNKTGISLDQSAWSKNNGVEIIFKNADTGARQAPVSLAGIDPKQNFTRSTQVLSWRGDVDVTGMRHASVAVWYVTDDGDFSNNEQTIDVPESCTNKKSNK